MNNQVGYDINCSIVCERGVISLNTPNNTTVKIAESSRLGIPPEFTERFRSAYDRQVQEFVSGVKADKITGPTIWDALVSQVTCDALAESRDQNGVRKPIVLPEKPAFYR